MKKVLYLICLVAIILSCNKENKTNNALDSTHQEIQNISDRVSSLFNDTTEKYCEGLKSINVNGKFGFVDSIGNIVIKPQFDNVGCFNEGLASVCVDGKFGYINHAGEYVVEPKYDFTNYFSQGVAAVVKNEKWGYIDKKGQEIIELQYDSAEDFSDANGFAAVSKNGKYGLIDNSGKIVFPLEYEGASGTLDGVARLYPFDKNIICIYVYNDGRIVKETLK